MEFEEPEDFYKLYAAFKQYQTPVVKNKHMRWYDREFWIPARCTPKTSVLEIGSGTGEFLAYLKRKKVGRFLGIERDSDAVAVMEAGLEGHVHVGDVWAFLEDTSEAPFDRVAMLDVLEHFSVAEGVRLLEMIKGVLQPGGLVVARVPNMGSHKSAYTATSLEQLGSAAGYKALAFVAQRRGSPFRRLTEDCLHGLLSRILTTTPTVWTPNIIVVWQLGNGVEAK